MASMKDIINKASQEAHNDETNQEPTDTLTNNKVEPQSLTEPIILEDSVDTLKATDFSANKSQVEYTTNVNSLGNMEELEFKSKPNTFNSTDRVDTSFAEFSNIKNDEYFTPRAELEPFDKVSLDTAEQVKFKDHPINVNDIVTEQHAVSYFVQEVKRRMRFGAYDNMINPLNNQEIEDAVYDALEEINNVPPITRFTPLTFIQNKRRYRRVVITCAAKFAVLTLISEWTANGLNVGVEDLSVDNKIGDFQSLLSTLNDEYKEQLQQMKQYDRLYVTSTTFSTGKTSAQKSRFSFRF